MTVETPSTETTSTLSNPLEESENLWRRYSGDDPDPADARTLPELVALADVVVVGRIAEVQLGRVDQIPDNPYFREQYVTYRIDVERSSIPASPRTIVLDGRLSISSPDLDAAFRERDLVKWEFHWKTAVRAAYTAEIECVPDNQTMFFFRIDEHGRHLFFDPTFVIVNDAGRAVPPVSVPTENLRPIWRDIVGVPFDEIVARVFHGAE